LRALWTQPITAAEIGRRLHTTKNAILGRAHRLNLPPRSSPISPVASDNARKAADAVRAGMAVKKAAAKYGCGHMSIRKLLTPAERRDVRLRADRQVSARAKARAACSAPKPKPLPKPTVFRPMPARAERTCHFIVGDPRIDGAWCGKRAARGVYCADHYAVCFTSAAQQMPDQSRSAYPEADQCSAS
jgi:GcrA cell cycle regulator